ncbi:MAG: hypothetical protein AAGA54_29205 [Myxococcota bacterium]
MRLLTSALLATTLLACAPRGATEAPRPAPTFGPGLVMVYTYPSEGASFRVEVLDANVLRFEGVAGPPKGFKGSTTYRVVDIAPGVVLINWGEDGGVLMTMVVDLADGQVHAREVRDGKLRALDGTIAVESAP